MALIKCPNCGQNISDKAPQCPKCGFKPHHHSATQPEESSYKYDHGQEVMEEEEKSGIAKYWIYLIVGGVFIIVVAVDISLGRGNNDRYYDYKMYDTPEDTASYYQESAAIIEDAAQDPAISAQERLEEFKSLPELKNYKALYEVKDKAGQIFNIYFTKDDSAIITSGSGNIYYCTLSDYTSLGDGYYIESTDEAVPIEYEGGKININYIMVLKDNWLYGKIDYAKSNNPKWRLPVTLKGGSMRSENKKSESSSQGSGSSNEEQLT